MPFYYKSLKSSKHPLTLRLKKYSMPFKKIEVTLKFLKSLHLEKLLLAYVIVLLMSYNFCNHNIFISLKIAVIFKVDKVIVPPTGAETILFNTREYLEKEKFFQKIFQIKVLRF